MKPIATLFIGLCLACVVSLASAAPTAQEILAESDSVRNPSHPFGVFNELTEYRNGKKSNASRLQIYSKANASGGHFKSLVRFLEPARDANKLMLYNGKDLWFYDPANRANIRLSPQQRLLGQVSNGDLFTVNLAKDYIATLVGIEEIKDGDRKLRKCYKLALAARSADVNYHHLEMWVDESNYHPVRARYYAESGTLLKTAYFRRYKHQLGIERPTESVVIDGLDPKWVTVMRFTGWAQREIPDAWLQRDYLPRFQPE